MSEKPKKKAEFFKMPPSGIDWSDPESIAEAMDDIFRPFDFDRNKASEAEDSREINEKYVEDPADTTAEQKS